MQIAKLEGENTTLRSAARQLEEELRDMRAGLPRTGARRATRAPHTLTHGRQTRGFVKPDG